MDAAHSSEASINIYQITLRNNTKDALFGYNEIFPPLILQVLIILNRK
jgi:hypothetical protein